MTETKSPSSHSYVPFVRVPFGCTLFLLDFMAVVYVVTHWAQVSQQVARLVEMIP